VPSFKSLQIVVPEKTHLGGGVRRFCHTQVFSEILSKFSVNTNNVELKSQFLSGGNLQKLIIGRELITSPELLICFNPTWGLDVGAINYIHETLIKINEQKKSIILISTDTDELLKLSDKICVIYKGKLSKIMDANDVTSEKLGLLMGGGEID
jgi:simple sugar transport system ATP-binding protein